jgi:glycolate oxidase FAD binding subunit
VVAATVRDTGGHATLVRGSAALRGRVDVFPPPGPGLQRIVTGLKLSFDPQGLFNPGLMDAA